jgi:hypothetical protein
MFTNDFSGHIRRNIEEFFRELPASVRATKDICDYAGFYVAKERSRSASLLRDHCRDDQYLNGVFVKEGCEVFPGLMGIAPSVGRSLLCLFQEACDKIDDEDLSREHENGGDLRACIAKAICKALHTVPETESHELDKLLCSAGRWDDLAFSIIEAGCEELLVYEGQMEKAVILVARMYEACRRSDEGDALTMFVTEAVQEFLSTRSELSKAPFVGLIKYYDPANAVPLTPSDATYGSSAPSAMLGGGSQ